MKRILISLLLVVFCASSAFAAQAVTETYTIQSTTNISAKLDDLGKGVYADVPAVIEKDGKNYTAVSVVTEVVKEEKRIEETKTFTNTKKEDLPKTIIVDGKKLKLESDSIDEEIIIRDAVTGTHSWTGCSEEPDIPESMQFTTDSGFMVTGYLQNVESSHSKTPAEYEIPATFIGDKDCQYYVINGRRIPNTFSEPTFEGFENEILTYLNLPATEYKITGGKWTSGYITENDQTVRHAAFTCSADILTDYTAYYTENLTTDSPGYSSTDITATYSNGIEDVEYEIVATVEYDREGLLTKAFVMVSAGIALLALLSVLILAVIKRKKKEEGEQ